MSEDERVPIAEALPGFELHPLDDGWSPLYAFVLLKALDDDGHSRWTFRTSESLNLEELLGALTIQVDILRDKLMDLWDEDDD